MTAEYIPVQVHDATLRGKREREREYMILNDITHKTTIQTALINETHQVRGRLQACAAM